MSIREIPAAAITDAVEALCIEANTRLPADVKAALDAAEAAEPWPLAKETLGLLQQNLCVAKEKDLPICQDTGMACVFIELGQDAHIDGDLTDAVNEGVRRGYEKAFLRKSITADPLQRVNTGDNTPAFLTVHLVPGSGCKITVAPKGAGSENMSRLAMLKPADGVEGVKKFVLDTVEQAGANPCPPIVLGIGIGGSFDHCAALAKKALLRSAIKALRSCMVVTMCSSSQPWLASSLSTKACGITPTTRAPAALAARATSPIRPLRPPP